MKNDPQPTIAESIICLANRFESIANRYVFKPMNLSSISFQILKLLKIHGSLTASDLIEALNATKSNISQRLNFLEKAGYVTKIYASDKTDKRKIRLNLTPLGKKTILNLEKRFQKAQITFGENFSQEELLQHEKFISKIKTILDNEEIELDKIFKN